MNRTRFAVLLACVALTPCLQLRAQYPRVGIEGQVPMGELGEMEFMLTQSSPAQKIDLLQRLGVESPVAEVTVQELSASEKIELRPIRSTGATPLGLAFLPGFRGCHLYLLQGARDASGKPAWHAISNQILDCWDGTAALELLPLRQQETDDLVFHHVNLDHGSNILVDETQVFSLLGGKLVKVLSTEDRRSQWTPGDAGEELSIEQSSTFLPFPGAHYEETRSTRENEVLKTVERRYWRWSAAESRFIAGPFNAVAGPSQ